MKRIVFLCSLVTAALFAQSQVPFAHTKTNPNGTITNTGTDTSSIAIAGYYEVVNVTLAVTKTSGTLAGTSVLQRSGNGTDWESVLGDTLTVTNTARVAKQIHIVKPDWLYLRVLTTGSGTMVGSFVGTVAAKKQSF